EPFLSRRGDIVPLLLRSVARLLLARDPMAREKPPHGPIADREIVTLPERIAQLDDRHVRHFFYLRENEIGVRLDALRAAIAAHLTRRDFAGDLDALRPTHR